MNSNQKSLVWVFLALSIILVGLMLVCAQRQASQGGGADLSADDDQFRQELLEMLDLADDLDSGESTEPTTESDVQIVGDSEDDVLALLVPESDSDTETMEANDLQTFSPEPSETPQTMGLSEEMFIKVRNDVNRLERILAERSTAVDSLRRIVENRDARIRELEQRMAQGRSYATPTRTQYSSSGATSAATPVASSAFMGSYQSARSQFESFRYQDAIDSMQSLLNNYPDHKMADNCQYWIGESYFGMKQYQKAILEFQKVFAYAQTDKHDDAQLMIGLCYMRLQQRDMAKKEFETFINTYGNSEYYGIAQRYYSNT